MNNPTTGEWTAGHDGTGKWGIYHGNETKKGWSGKGRLLVDGLLESQAKEIETTHNSALAAAVEALNTGIKRIKAGNVQAGLMSMEHALAKIGGKQ